MTKPQAVSERKITRRLEPINVVDLEAYDILLPQHIGVSSSGIVINDRGRLQAAVLDKNSMLLKQWVGRGRGDGPGEVSGIGSIDVDNEQILFVSDHQLVVYNMYDSLIVDLRLEQETKRAAAIDGNLYAVLSPTNSENLFSVIDLSGQITQAFQPTNLSELSPLHYEGSIAIASDALFYVGFSQSFIKKYSLSDTSLVYSVATIDNYESSGNYIVFNPGGEQTGFTFSPTAIYSSLSIVSVGPYIVVVPVMDDELERVRLLDVYAASDGSYIESFEIERIPAQVIFTDSHLYVLEDAPDEKRRLGIYLNPLGVK